MCTLRGRDLGTVLGREWHGCCALVSARCPGDGGEVLRGARQKADRPVGRWRPASPSTQAVRCRHERLRRVRVAFTGESGSTAVPPVQRSPAGGRQWRGRMLRVSFPRVLRRAGSTASTLPAISTRMDSIKWPTSAVSLRWALLPKPVVDRNSSCRRSSDHGKRCLLRASLLWANSLDPVLMEELRAISLTCPWAGAATPASGGNPVRGPVVVVPENDGFGRQRFDRGTRNLL